VSLTEWGNAQAESFANNGDAFGLVLLSASGTAPATHTACNVRVSPETLASIEAAAATEPDAVLYVGDNYTWDAVLALAGLQVIASAVDL
jgi:hypothetical protein